MDDQFYYVSIVISSESSTIKNELLRIDKPLDPQEAEEFDTALVEWMKLVPIPGKQPEFLIPLESESEDAEDTLLSDQLNRILDRKDNFEWFVPSSHLDFNPVIASTPYDWTQAKEVVNG